MVAIHNIEITPEDGGFIRNGSMPKCNVNDLNKSISGIFGNELIHSTKEGRARRSRHYKKEGIYNNSNIHPEGQRLYFAGRYKRLYSKKMSQDKQLEKVFESLQVEGKHNPSVKINSESIGKK